MERLRRASVQISLAALITLSSALLVDAQGVELSYPSKRVQKKCEQILADLSESNRADAELFLTRMLQPPKDESMSWLRRRHLKRHLPTYLKAFADHGYEPSQYLQQWQSWVVPGVASGVTAYLTRSSPDVAYAPALAGAFVHSVQNLLRLVHPFPWEEPFRKIYVEPSLKEANASILPAISSIRGGWKAGTGDVRIGTFDDLFRMIEKMGTSKEDAIELRKDFDKLLSGDVDDPFLAKTMSEVRNILNHPHRELILALFTPSLETDADGWHVSSDGTSSFSYTKKADGSRTKEVSHEEDEVIVIKYRSLRTKEDRARFLATVFHELLHYADAFAQSEFGLAAVGYRKAKVEPPQFFTRFVPTVSDSGHTVLQEEWLKYYELRANYLSYRVRAALNGEKLAQEDKADIQKYLFKFFTKKERESLGLTTLDDAVRIANDWEAEMKRIISEADELMFSTIKDPQ